jgi:SEC-C motif-containing protein
VGRANKPGANKACPCGSGDKYKRCCRPLHRGAAPASPEALMRSRFSAYALGEVEYILASTHPQSPLAQRDRETWAGEVEAFCRATTFEGLEIRSARAEAGVGEVVFVARLSRGGEDVSFGERSKFLREGDRWLYHSGAVFQV